MTVYYFAYEAQIDMSSYVIIDRSLNDTTAGSVWHERSEACRLCIRVPELKLE